MSSNPVIVNLPDTRYAPGVVLVDPVTGLTSSFQQVVEAALSSLTDSTTTAGYVYFCEAAPGTATSTAAWRISRMNTSTGQLQWAAGFGTFSQVADNRASLTYV